MTEKSVALLLVVALIYFLPFLVANRRGHPARISILVIDLFLGWTLLGWVLALAWAFGPIRQPD